MLTIDLMSLTELIAVTICLILAAFVYVAGKHDRRKVESHGRRYPPSLPSLPVVGSLPFLRNIDNISDFFFKKSQQLGPIFSFTAGSKYVVVLNTKEVIEEALVRNSKTFSSRPFLFGERIFNKNRKGFALVDTSPEWKRTKQVALSIFKEFGFGAKTTTAARIHREIEAMIEFVSAREERAFDPKELSVLMTSNVILSVLFGRRCDYDCGPSELVLGTERAIECVNFAFEIAPFLRFIPPYRKRLAVFVETGKRVIQLVEEELEKTLLTNDDCYVRRYIDLEGPNYDREQLVFILRDLMIAGVDAVALYLQWSLVLLANRGEIQHRLQAEIDSVIPRDRFPESGDEARLPYVQATILELHRWRTLAYMSLPRTTMRDSIVSGVFIPAGTMVIPNIYAAHSDPAVWPEPELFRPERFLDEDNKIIGSDRIVPFSIGRRSCLGETLARDEIFLFLTSLLQRFTVSPPEGQTSICDEPVLPIPIALKPRPFSVRIVRRK